VQRAQRTVKRKVACRSEADQIDYFRGYDSYAYTGR
jgi:hypothetical protein